MDGSVENILLTFVNKISDVGHISSKFKSVQAFGKIHAGYIFMPDCLPIYTNNTLDHLNVNEATKKCIELGAELEQLLRRLVENSKLIGDFEFGVYKRLFTYICDLKELIVYD